MIDCDAGAETISGNGFDRLAQHYYWMECVLAGRTLQKCRTAFLDETRVATTANNTTVKGLDINGFTGIGVLLSAAELASRCSFFDSS